MHGPDKAAHWPSMRQVARLQCSVPGWTLGWVYLAQWPNMPPKSGSGWSWPAWSWYDPTQRRRELQSPFSYEGLIVLRPETDRGPGPLPISGLKKNIPHKKPDFAIRGVVEY